MQFYFPLISDVKARLLFVTLNWLSFHLFEQLQAMVSAKITPHC